MRIEVPSAFYNEGSNYTGRIAQALHLDGDLAFQGAQQISTTSGDLTVNIDGDIILDADGGDIFFKDDGTTFGSATNTSGNLIIKSGTTTAMTFSGADLTMSGAIDMGNNTLTGGTGDLNWDSGTLFVDSSADKVAINRTSSLLAALDVIRTGSSVQIAIAPGNLTSAADGVGASIHYQGNTAGQSMIDLAGVWEADATSASFKVETRNAGTMQQQLVIKGDGEVDFKSRSPGLSNIGAAGNDFGASTLDLAAGYTISGAGELTVEAASGNLNLGNTGNMKFLRGASTMALIGASGIRLASDTAHGTTAGTNLISIFNGTAPVGTLANGASFFCAAGEMKVIDAAGNVTVLSPHDDDGQWIFDSRDSVTGRGLRIQMEQMMRRLDEMLGGGFIEEFTEDIGA